MLYSPGTSVTHNVKYLKDLPYTRLGKHVHLAARARMLMISTRLTCVDGDTVYLDGERRHALSFTGRMGSVLENGQVHVQTCRGCGRPGTGSQVVVASLDLPLRQ